MTTPSGAFDRQPDATPPSLILEVCTRAVFHAAVVFAIWLLAAGHNRPGGGFVGGLTISAALVLTYASGGSHALRRVLPVRPLTFLGVGMLVAQATAFVPLLLGRNVLESAAVTLQVPLFGAVKVTTPLFFDIGVLLIVLGLVAKALDTLGAVDPAAEHAVPPHRRQPGLRGGTPVTAVLAIAVGGLFALGTYLLLQRALTRIVIGLGLVGHGTNLLLLLVGGGAGRPPIVGEDPGDLSRYADPLPQALALTAIVISFGVGAFLLALSWRSFATAGDDEVEDDLEDRRVARMLYATAFDDRDTVGDEGVR